MRRVRVIVAGVAIAVLLSVWAGTGTALAFTDVPDSHRYARAINELARLGIVSGTEDGTFRPDDPVYRAQFAKMMCGLLEIAVSEDQSFAPFLDLGPDDLGDLYPHEFVGAAYQAGITKGTTATAFSPYTNITLAQVVTMVVRAADAHHPGLLATPPGDWYGWWADGDPTHGANVRRADYTDLLAFLPTEDDWTDVWRPATRGEVSQILVNLRDELEQASVSVSLEGNRLDLTSPIYTENNRYYMPLAELIGSIGGTITTGPAAVHLEVNDIDVDIDITDNQYVANGQTVSMRNRSILTNDIVYISLFDLHKMLNLKVAWDEERGIIGLFWNRDTIVEDKQPLGGKTALVRFEDVTSAQSYRYASAESLEKLRTIFDYCYAKGIPMQLGWVPRYIDLENGIDNAPAEDYDIHNANFIYTLDYFADKNGLIGLHGYTHQYGTEVSIYGTEFDGTHNTSASSIIERLQDAIEDAQVLDIPIAFFESPHYAATPYQKGIVGQYFDIIYEYKVSAREKNVTRVNVGDRTLTYIPTPLGYIDGAEDTDTMIARIRDLEDDELGSFFYHPSIEFDCINANIGSDGYPSYEYLSDSPLHRVVRTFMDEGYTFMSIGSF